MKHIEADIAPTRRASPGDLLPAGGGKARIRQFLAFLPKALLAGLLILAILDMLAGVLLRYVVVAVTEYFDLPGVNFFWVEEVGEFTLAWLTLVGAAIAILERTHFELAILVHRFPEHIQQLITRINYWLIAAFGLLTAIHGWRLAAINSVLLSPALEINLAWLYLSAAAGGALIAMYAAAIALGLIERKPAAIEGP
jgi:TRAP-type C4-dicarboxylate transport system permease small subunit